MNLEQLKRDLEHELDEEMIQCIDDAINRLELYEGIIDDLELTLARLEDGMVQ